MCVIEAGEPHIKHDFEAGRIRKFKAGSGLPLKVTVVDMIEIGTGGGSIAHIGEGGLMKSAREAPVRCRARLPTASAAPNRR